MCAVWAAGQLCGFDKQPIVLHNSFVAIRETDRRRSDPLDTESVPAPPPSTEAGRIGFLGVFASAAVESTYREDRFHDHRWLNGFLVTAGMLRVAFMLVADYHHF